MNGSVDKLSFDNMDFKFLAAYGQYSEKFDIAQSEEQRIELNEAITLLQTGKISYQDYYKLIDKETDERNRYHRAKINTSRKFQYRENQRKVDRIKRHK